MPDGKLSSPPQLKIPPKTDGRRCGDWLAAFLDHTADLEVPHNYLLWSGLSTLAAVAQRKIYRDTQSYTVYPNLYVWVVGPPGSRKTTAIRAGRKLLQPLKDCGVYLTSDAPSVVGLMKDFNDIANIQKDHQSLNGFIYELSTFFENAAEAMTGFLTAIYDGDADYTKRTRIGEKEHIPFPWFNMLAGTTPRWLGDNLNKNAVEGGLVARTLFIYSNEIFYEEPEPEISKDYLARSKVLSNDLAHILGLHGQFEWEGGREGDAFRFFRDFYRSRDRLPRVPDNRTQGYFVRKHIHLQKVAMLLSLAQDDSKLFRLKHIEAAKDLLEKYVEPSMKRAFSAVGGNPYATDFERICEQIESAGKMTLQEVVNANYHQISQDKMEMTLTSLVASGRIIRSVDHGIPCYTPKPVPPA